MIEGMSNERDVAAHDNVVRDDPARERYELRTPDGPAIAAYQRDGDSIILTHTMVPTKQEGRGVASRLIAGVLADLRARGLTVVPQCPFVATYIDRHPAERDLLATVGRP